MRLLKSTPQESAPTISRFGLLATTPKLLLAAAFYALQPAQDAGAIVHRDLASGRPGTDRASWIACANSGLMGHVLQTAAEVVVRIPCFTANMRRWAR
jgi:hypothetical protein